MIPEWKPIEEPPLIPKAVWIAAPIVLLAAGVGYYWYTHRQPEVAPPPVAQTLPPPKPVAQPSIKNPLPGADGAADSALPPLDSSDAALRAALVPLAPHGDVKTIDQFLVPEKLVRNFVVTIDNLPRSKTAVDRRPVKATPGATVVETQGDEITLSAQNYARYTPFVTLVQSTDAKQLASVYFHYYPLFQQSYEELGYPDKYFNDRLVEVIDDLLATPAPQGPVKLTQPRVFYEYADPALEQLSAGQKVLLRMGNANAAQVKKKLRELRALIAKGPPPAEPKTSE